MGNRRDIIVLAGVLFTIVVIAFVARPARSGESDDPRASTFLTGARGTAALFMLMDELDIPAERQLHEWTADSASGALVVLAPTQAPTPREQRVLREWIEAGGTLIYGARGAIDGMLGLRIEPTIPDSLGALETVRWEGVSAFPETHAWTTGVDSVFAFMHVFDPGSLSLRGSAATVLLRTREGDATVVSFPVGAGRVIAFSDATVLGNHALRESDAALLFARVADAATVDGRALRFDEYHHGYRQASPLRAIFAALTGTGIGRAVLQGVVACLALLLLAGARFGAPVREHGERRRSPLEHMQALAGAYERAGARQVARRLLAAGMERQLGRRVFGGEGRALPPAALDGSAAGRRLKEEWERGEDGSLTGLAGAVDEFVREVRGWK